MQRALSQIPLALVASWLTTKRPNCRHHGIKVLSACGYSICGSLGAPSSSIMSSIFSSFLDLSSFLQVENSWSILFVSAHYFFSSPVPLFQAQVPSLHFGCLISYFCDQLPLPNLSLSNPNSSIVWLLVSDGRGWRLLSSFLLFKSWSMPVLIAYGCWIWIRLTSGLIERDLGRRSALKDSMVPGE